MNNNFAIAGPTLYNEKKSKGKYFKIFYYDEYAKYNTITIFCLPRSFSGSVMTEEEAVKVENGPIFFVKLFECYPTKIEDVTMNYSDAEKIMELSVTISYKYFKTITDLNFPSVTVGYDRSWEQTL